MASYLFCVVKDDVTINSSDHWLLYCYTVPLLLYYYTILILNSVPNISHVLDFNKKWVYCE